MGKIKEELMREQEFRQKELEASEQSGSIYNCRFCEDTGIIEEMGGDDWDVIKIKRCKHCENED